MSRVHFHVRVLVSHAVAPQTPSSRYKRVLIRRLNRLSEAGNQTTGTHIRVREFSIGDKVKILNPGPLQAKTGTIIRIGVGTNRITVLAEDGTKIVRASSNLQHG